MARGVKGTGPYSRAKYTGTVHGFWIVLWVIVFIITCVVAVVGK